MKRLYALANTLIHRPTVFLNTASLTLESSTLRSQNGLREFQSPSSSTFFWRANNLGRVAALRTQPLR